MGRRRRLCVFLSLVAGVSQAPAADLFNAIRNADRGSVQRLLATKAALDTTDDSGASPLMYAALYADVSTMRLLLDRGADPNHADNSGATALMWAVPDEAKVRLLLDRGAAVNAVSNLTGRTALLIAAGKPGASSVVRLLLQKGADPKAVDAKKENAIYRATYSGDIRILNLLIDKGADVNAATEFTDTALMDAVAQGNYQIAQLLIAKGAKPDAREEFGANALAGNTSYRDFSIYKLLIGKGADPSARSKWGYSFAMAVAASDTTSPEVLREMANLKLDLKSPVSNLHTQHGFGAEPESPLDWAARQGDTPTMRLLAELTSSRPRTEPVSKAALLNAPSPRIAIESALPLLYDGGKEFFKRSGCTSCHHNVLPAVAFAAARAKGIALDADKVLRNYQQSVAWLKGSLDPLLQDVRFPGGDTTLAYLLWQLESDGHKSDRITDAIFCNLLTSQATDGGWRVRADRPPIESGRVTPTALAIRALRMYPISGRKEEAARRIQDAVRWLEAYRARTSEERCMRLLGLVWAGSNSRAVRDEATQLASVQRQDGGWAQLDTLSSDAYATGQALYALSSAGQLSKGRLERGIRFLLDAQHADGSWHVRSRSYPLQTNYLDTGFPHGRDQWISAAATSWACIGLSLALPNQ